MQFLFDFLRKTWQPSIINNLHNCSNGKEAVQECPEALNTLKYFREKANEYHIIAAESLLGTLLAQPKSYPVGMVNLLELEPLSFDEFLRAVDAPLYTYYCSIEKGQTIEEIFHHRLTEAYQYYLIIGGMPECVSSWIKYKDPARISRIQQDLIQIYENDFSKHNGQINSGRILMVFRSIVSQLAKPNEKFMYGAVREGGRARDFEEAIEWLVSSCFSLTQVSSNKCPALTIAQS